MQAAALGALTPAEARLGPALAHLAASLGGSHGWLRDENEHGARLPVIEVDLPFKVGRDNNRNYRWGQQADAPAPLPNGGYPR